MSDYQINNFVREMVGCRRENAVVCGKRQRSPPDAVNLLLFTPDRPRNVRQLHTAGILARGHLRNVCLVVFDIFLPVATGVY